MSSLNVDNSSENTEPGNATCKKPTISDKSKKSILSFIMPNLMTNQTQKLDIKHLSSTENKSECTKSSDTILEEEEENINDSKEDNTQKSNLEI